MRSPWARGRSPTAPGTAVSSERVWQAVATASFAVVSHVTPSGEPRSSGVMYASVDRHLYVVTAPDSYKARQITDGDRVAVTIPVRRGGLLSLVAPIPPATITFRARVIVHPAGSVDIAAVSKRFASLLPEQRLRGCVLELVPEGRFLTYGLGVPLMRMRDPDAALARVPVVS